MQINLDRDRSAMVLSGAAGRLRAACSTRVQIPASTIAAFYVVLAAVFVLLLAVLMPPIQGPDEGAHFVRADQISRGSLISRRLDPGASGGVIDLGIMEAIHRFYPIVVEPAARARPAMYSPIAWGDAGQWSFPNTAVYPPIFYLPAAGAIFLGKQFGADVLHTDIGARIAQGIASVAIAGAALSLAGPAALWLFALLLLPSSAALMGSLTQDGPMLASAALAAAYLLQLGLPREPKIHRRHLLVASVIIALMGMSRPPYAAMGLLMLAPSNVPLRTRLIFGAGAWLASLAWWVLCAVHIFVSVDQSHAADAAAQLHLLLTHPGRIPALIGASLQAGFVQDYAGFFITTFAPPGWFNAVAWVVLAYAAIATIVCGSVAKGRAVALTGMAASAATAGIFLLQYLTWTPVGAATVYGVLGRYFLPVAALLPLAMIARPDSRWRIPGIALVPLFGFPVVSIVTTLRHLVFRYYF